MIAGPTAIIADNDGYSCGRYDVRCAIRLLRCQPGPYIGGEIAQVEWCSIVKSKYHGKLHVFKINKTFKQLFGVDAACSLSEI